MAHSKITSVVQKLANATQRGVTDWKETEVEDMFQVSFSDSSIRIGIRQGLSTHEDEYFISIFNSEGDLVEQIGDEDGDDPHQRAALFVQLKETYETARRKAKGVEKVLDEILRELDDDFPF